MENKNSKSSNVAEIALIGATLAGIAATAYFFFGPKGSKNQKALKSWAIKMRAEVIEKMEAAKEMTEPIYNEIIDSIANDYTKSMKAGKDEIFELAEDLKKHWGTISKSAQIVKKDLDKTVKRVAKKIK